MISVLVVDDDRDLRETLCEVLRDDGNTVHAANDGAEALALLRGGAPVDVILLDLMMPRMTGWEFRKAQLADAALAGIPVVVMTAAADLDKHPIDAGAVLQKPVELATLLRAVAAARR